MMNRPTLSEEWITKKRKLRKQFYEKDSNVDEIPRSTKYFRLDKQISDTLLCYVRNYDEQEHSHADVTADSPRDNPDYHEVCESSEGVSVLPRKYVARTTELLQSRYSSSSSKQRSTFVSTEKQDNSIKTSYNVDSHQSAEERGSCTQSYEGVVENSGEDSNTEQYNGFYGDESNECSDQNGSDESVNGSDPNYSDSGNGGGSEDSSASENERARDQDGSDERNCSHEWENGSDLNYCDSDDGSEEGGSGDGSASDSDSERVSDQDGNDERNCSDEWENGSDLNYRHPDDGGGEGGGGDGDGSASDSERVSDQEESDELENGSDPNYSDPNDDGGGGGGGGDNSGSENGRVSDDDDIPCEPFKELNSKLQNEFKNQMNLRVNISVGEILLNVLNLTNKHHMNHSEKSDLMKLLQAILKTWLPSSRYLLDKYLYSKIGMCYHFFCSKCSQYLGDASASSARAGRLVCRNEQCKEINLLDDLSLASYFVTFELQSQLELLFEDPEIRNKLMCPSDFIEEPTDGILRDLHHGSSYRSFASYVQNDVTNGLKIISLTVFVDSASLCHFSGKKICPCFIAVNELPPVLRMKHLLLAGLWFGAQKEKISLFLSPIVNHIKKLSKVFVLRINGDAWHMKAYVISCVADSVARCDIQGIHGHRGDFPCSWCLIEGEEWGGVRVFRYTWPPPPLRSIQELLHDAREALRTGFFVNGVKYLSVLAPAPLFHIVDGFILDQMHAKDEGTTKSFLKAWLNAGVRSPFYISSPENINKISRLLKAVTVPRELRRSARPLKDLPFWTARELENFEFFFSIPVLINILPKRYLDHWALYVQGTYILMSSTVSMEAINYAENVLLEFCRKVDIYYNSYMLRFNLHLLLHFAQNTRRWGPMYALSSNAFEAGIQKLKKVIHNGNYIPSQIARALSEEKARNILERECTTPLTRRFEELIDRKAHDIKVLHVGKIKLIGHSKKYDPTDEERFLLRQKALPLENWLSFKLLIKDGIYYGPKPVNRNKRVDNSHARLENNIFIQIQNIWFNELSSDILVVSSKIRCQPSPYCPVTIVRNIPDLCFQFLVTSIDEDFQLNDVSQLETVCVSLRVDHGHFLCPLPNVYNIF